MLVNDHPSLEQFNIQLWRRVSLQLQKLEIETPRSQVPATPTLLGEGWKVKYPKDFRLLRCLCIVHWMFTNEFLRWRVHLDLDQSTFSWLNDNQKIVLRTLLSSKETCERYLFLTKSVTRREIFGNILGNDLRDLSQTFRIIKCGKLKPPTRPVWRRGYRDKGSRVPDHQWREKFDSTFTSEQNRFEHRRNIVEQSVVRINRYLSELDFSNSEKP